ncbi:WD40-repeat-containing domain protein [Powellomyces hirtus]|nr:WD40-repeat-containing domain protein [Powellomyces hirtus]
MDMAEDGSHSASQFSAEIHLKHDEHVSETDVPLETPTAVDGEAAAQWTACISYDFTQGPVKTCTTGRTLCNNLVTTGDVKGGLNSNFCKALKWSPDGTCLLSSTADNTFRVFEKPADIEYEGSTIVEAPLTPVLTISEPECVYDFQWYPLMNSTDPATCCFLSSVRDHPIRLWDAYTGQLRCSYVAFDHLDQVQAPNCLTFNLDGTKLYCGFNNLIQIFDTHRPGRDCVRKPTSPNKKSKKGQKGLISSIAFNPDQSGMYAAGSYTGSIGLYDERNDELLCQMRDTDGRGITQVEFSRDGSYLFSASRKSDKLLAWDIRNTGDILATYPRLGNTNQRISFSLDPSGRYLSTGDQTGDVLIYDLHTNELAKRFQGHQDVVSSAVFHPTLPLLGTCSGQRRDIILDAPVYDANGAVEYIDVDASDADTDEDEEGDEEEGELKAASANRIVVDSSVAIWRVPHEWVPITGEQEQQLESQETVTEEMGGVETADQQASEPSVS